MAGKILDQTYQLLEEIGRGGFGVVYRAVRLGFEGSGSFAIKVLNRKIATRTGEHIRFQKEASYMSQLVHPGIVAVYELGETDNCYYIVMEDIKGKNLREFEKGRGGHLSLLEALEILIQAAEALDFVHSYNIVHRDIKPHNILIAPTQDEKQSYMQVKLVDFGVAQITSEFEDEEKKETERKQKKAVVGTYSYMAPEATGLTRWSIDHRADIYSLGIVAFELFSGRTPFADLSKDELIQAQISKQPPKISDVLGYEIPAVLEKIVFRCLEKDPQQRYQSMFALVCDLKKVQKDLLDHGKVLDFNIATKDVGLNKTLQKVFVGRDEEVKEILEFVDISGKSSRISCGMVYGVVGVGKTRLFNEISSKLSKNNLLVLMVRFSETSQAVPFQAFSHAINDMLIEIDKAKAGGAKELFRKLQKSLQEDIYYLIDLVPIFRQYAHAEGITHHPETKNSVAEATLGGENPRELQFDDMLDNKTAAPGVRFYQTLLELFQSLAEDHPQLIFILDSIHFADASTLSIFKFMLEQVSRSSKFKFLFSAREHSLVENESASDFIAKISHQNRKYKEWHLPVLNQRQMIYFLNEVGITQLDEKSLSTISRRTRGIPAQLHRFIKLMLAEDALQAISLAEGVRFEIRSTMLSGLNENVISIDMLIQSLRTTEQRDLQLLCLAAVSNEACNFEYFHIEKEYTDSELESRLQNLVEKGYLEVIGSANAPIKQRSFAFSHEKLRRALLNLMDTETRCRTHLLIARRMESLFPRMTKDQVTLLAKHYSGAGKFADPRRTIPAMVRAVKIYIGRSENNMARFYIDKSLQKVGEIPIRDEQIVYLREVLEAEYMLLATEGNLVAASEICRKLIEITYDPGRKLTLQVYWSQMLLGLGRHAQSYREARLVLRYSGLLPKHTVRSKRAELLLKYTGTKLFSLILFVFNLLWGTRRPLHAQQVQAIALMGLSQMHGCETNFKETYWLMVMKKVLSQPLTRWSGMCRLVYAGLLLRQGRVQEAYKVQEKVEKFFDASGMEDAKRWARSFRTIWLDYPLGRIDRLYSMFDKSLLSKLPQSGIMHFESQSLRSWLRLLSPRMHSAKAMTKVERNRRRTDENQKPENESLLENKGARRILDAGENGPYTSVTLFSDSLRNALQQKMDPLQANVSQLRRQVTRSECGAAFADFAESLLALLNGQHREALHFYSRGISHFLNTSSTLESLLIIDGIRLATVCVPLFAVSMRVKGWPWGKHFAQVLSRVEQKCQQLQGKNNPARTPFPLLIKSYQCYLNGKMKKSLLYMEKTIHLARAQRFELIEGFALMSMGCFLAGKSGRAQESFMSAFRICHDNGWRWMMKIILGLSKQLQFKLDLPALRDDMTSSTGTKVTKVINLNHFLLRIQKLTQLRNVNDLFLEGCRLACAALSSHNALVYFSQEKGKKLEKVYAFGNVPTSIEYELSKLLPKDVSQPIRFISAAQDIIEPAAQAQFAGADDAATVAEDTVTQQKTKSKIEKPTATPSTPQNLVHVLVALQHGSDLVGWIVLPKVEISATSEWQTEQDLLLLGLHVGHNAMRLSNKTITKTHTTLNGTENTHQTHTTIIEHENEVTSEISFIMDVFERKPRTLTNAIRVHALGEKCTLAVHWDIRSADQQRFAAEAGETIDRHFEFMGRSAKQNPMAEKNQKQIEQIFSDLFTLLTAFIGNNKLEAFNLTVCIIDKANHVAYETSYGSPQYSFSGSGEIQSEKIHELNRILNADRLVYRQSVRKLTGSAGWLILNGRNSKNILQKFTQSDLILPQARWTPQDTLSLSNAIGLQNKNELCGVLILFIEHQELPLLAQNSF